MCEFIVQRLSKATVYYIINFFCVEFVTSNDWTPPPHTLQLPRASSPASLQMRLPTPSWLLSLIIKRRPPKVRAWRISLFFDVFLFGAPNRQTSYRAAKPDHRRLASDHRELQRHWLGAPVYCPWRERAKPVEGRVAAAHFGCCVLCCVLWLWQAHFRYRTLLVEKVEIGPAKMANFSTFITNICCAWAGGTFLHCLRKVSWAHIRNSTMSLTTLVLC